MKVIKKLLRAVIRGDGALQGTVYRRGGTTFNTQLIPVVMVKVPVEK